MSLSSSGHWTCQRALQPIYINTGTLEFLLSLSLLLFIRSRLIIWSACNVFSVGWLHVQHHQPSVPYLLPHSLAVVPHQNMTKSIKKMDNSSRTSATGRFQDFAAHVIGVSWLGERSILAPDTDTAAAISPSPQTSPLDPPFTRTVLTSRWRCLLSTRAGLISQAGSEGAPIGRTLIDPGGGNWTRQKLLRLQTGCAVAVVCSSYLLSSLFRRRDLLFRFLSPNDKFQYFDRKPPTYIWSSSRRECGL